MKNKEKEKMADLYIKNMDKKVYTKDYIKDAFKKGFDSAKNIYEPLFEEARKKYEGVIDEFSGSYSKWETPLDVAKNAIRESQSADYYSTVQYDVQEIVKNGGDLGDVMEYINKLYENKFDS